MIPTLSQIRSWGTEQLTSAAQQWSSLAAAWDDAVTAVDREVHQPGGTVWRGRAAEAAHARTHGDRIRVLALADALNQLAVMARGGASDLQTAKQRVLSAVAAANEAGFDVHEDLSVTGAKSQQAQAIAANLRTAAGALSSMDTDIAMRIVAASAALDNVTFAETPIADANPAQMYGTGGRSDWSILCVPTPAGGWNCNFLIGNGWYSENFSVPPV